MATKEGRTEIPDSEDDLMTSSPIEDDTGKLPANSSDPQQHTFQKRLQDVTCSHQATEHVPDTVSNRAQHLVVEQEDPSKDIELANTLPDNSLQQQHVTVEATSEEAKALKEPEKSEASRTCEQPDGSNSSRQPLGQLMQQGVDQGMSIGVEGVSKPISLHIDVPFSELRQRNLEPFKEMEVGEQKPEQITTIDLPRPEELENTSTDGPDTPPEASVDLTKTEVAGQKTINIETSADPAMAHANPAKQDQLDESHTLPVQSLILEEQPRDVPLSAPEQASAYTTMQGMVNSTPTQEPGLTTAATHVPPSEETNQLPQPQVPSLTKATSSQDKPSPIKGSQEATVAELRAQRATLIASLAALPNIQELIAEMEDDNDSARGPYDGPTEAEVMTSANKIVKTHIKLLHEYNEMKDVGQGLMGLIADSRGVRIVEVQDEFGIDAKD